MSIYFFNFFKIPNYINNNIYIGTTIKRSHLIARAAHPKQGKSKFLFAGMPALC